MSQHDPSANSGSAAAVTESPDRADPRLVTQYGDPLDVPVALDNSRAVSHSETERVRIATQATEPQRDEQRPHGGAQPAVPNEASEQAQRMRRVEEFARERHSVERWGGGEHSGTVVAAAADGIILHVGRNEYVRVPAQNSEPFSPVLLGRHVSINRGGEVTETRPSLERAGR
ncbi:MAG: hypothetical protein IAI50_03150 [Candidatus Eremiobacteraeota bacterium]|nr:hypothetical protein [Candidatus Eremiobacteraeota bacterium]